MKIRCGALLLWFAGLAAIALVFFFWHPTELPLTDRLQMKLLSPLAGRGPYWLGADEQGRPLIWQLLEGMSTSLRISLASIGLSLALGLPYGILAGWRRGLWEKSFLFLADSFQAFPGMLLAIALAAFLPATMFNLILILGIMGWVSFARVGRAQALTLARREFIQATHALGLPGWRVGLFHLLPNMTRPLVVQASFSIAGVILAEATLSFLGLGLPPSIPSLGKMMDSGVRYLLLTPHLAIIPGLAIFTLVLTFNLLGDSLADRFDPKR